MTSSRRFVCGAVLSIVAVACATSTAPLGGGGTIPGTGKDGGVAEGGLGNYGGDPDSGTPTPVHPPKDGGAPVAIDSGTPTPVVDSGPPTTGSNDCVGSQSTSLGESYTKACDYYYTYSDPSGAGNPCTPGGNDCAALDDSTTTFCCFTPKSTSYCYSDYGGQPQCIPQ